MRTPIRRLIDDASGGGDRRSDANTLGAGIVRLARLATSIHLVESAHRTIDSEPRVDRAKSTRESV